MEFLSGNPLATPVGQRVEHATQPGLQTEDWGLNMEICDIINETEEGPKDAVRAIKKRIVGNKNFQEVMLALSVLEACVKNCGHRFHLLVSTREFVEGVLVRAILPKNNPPLVIHDRVLSIIQAWADAFRSSSDLTGVVSVYEDLRRKGLEFPMTELSGYSPIHTPSRRVPECVSTVTVCATSPSTKRLPQQQQQHPPPAQRDGPLTLTPDQEKRVRTDLEVVRSNLTVMSDMMTQMDPNSVQESDTELLQQLYLQCKAVQDKLVYLIPRVTEEKLTEELLVANDDINTAFTGYHRFQRLCSEPNSTQQCPIYANLIDLAPDAQPPDQLEQTAHSHMPVSQSAVNTLSNQMASLATAEDTQKQSSSTLPQPISQENSGILDGLAAGHSGLQDIGGDNSPDSTPLGSSPQFEWMVQRGMIPINQSAVMDDIEKWLDFDEDEEVADAEGVTSEEFDRFLAERAKAAERLPSVKASSHDPDHSVL